MGFHGCDTSDPHPGKKVDELLKRLELLEAKVEQAQTCGAGAGPSWEILTGW